MLHWDDVQVGDIIKWNDGYSSFKIVKKVKSTDDWWLVDFLCIKSNLIYANDDRRGFFNYATIIKETSTKEQVLAKIKYLNLRYQQRQQHV